jgi:collagenase-like PrtC family protease
MSIAASRAPLELLSPAKNLEFGIAAINHGADAVYIGGPSFGARSAAGNSIEDIEQLARHAHRFNAHVYVALNTLLFDDELEAAAALAHQLYQAGADALIVQDMGLLQMDLPPIALHASTQTDNRTPEKVSFLQQVGFSQVVLARELTLEQIQDIAQQTSCTLEFFVHGALCVSYSGQCYLSYAHTGRSANRGECAQLCRLPYSLENAAGEVLAQDQHLLSLKDMNQSHNLDALIAAGVTSFKIEGRLKDLSYVKNVTAHYRQALDQILDSRPELARASSGRVQHGFTPQPHKSFNRGATDYFLHGRQMEIADWRTPKFIGEPIGTVAALTRKSLTLLGEQAIANGDGLCFFNQQQHLVGLRINRAEGRELFPHEMPTELALGTQLYRNGDVNFEKQLEKATTERRLALDLSFCETDDGFRLELCDEDGVTAGVALAYSKDLARNPEQAEATVREQLAKLGGTQFVAREIRLTLSQPYFIATSALNAMRRDAVAQLEAARLDGYQRPLRAEASTPPAQYPQHSLSYLGNVANQQARLFYQQHGVEQIAAAYECRQEAASVPLMITKHCLRYSLGQCPKEVKPTLKGPLTLVDSKQQRHALHFDCKRCEMHVLGQLRAPRPPRS